MVSWVTVGCGRLELALLALAWEAITKKASYLCLEVWEIWGISLNPIKQSLYNIVVFVEHTVIVFNCRGRSYNGQIHHSACLISPFKWI